MPFQKGNQLWRNLKWEDINKPKYKEPKELFDKFLEYMADNDSKSWSKPDFIKSGPDAGKMVYLDTPNPPSLGGFCVFANISLDTFRDYGKKTGEKANEWVAVTSTIREVVMQIQIDGATANVFNANIIARLSGLVDKKEVDVKSNLSDDQRRDLIKEILSKAPKKTENPHENGHSSQDKGSDLV